MEFPHGYSAVPEPLVRDYCTEWLPAPLDSRTNETVALDTSSGRVQPLILELRYAADGTPLIETATVRLLHSDNTRSSNLPQPLAVGQRERA